MPKIAFILLAHKDPEGLIAQAERLTAAGDFVAIHYDRKAPTAEFAALRAALGGNPRVVFSSQRHRCGWGAWSLVAATLSAVETAVATFPQASHFYMLSGDCMPIKTAEYAHALLAGEDADYIESFDFFTSNWIKTGFRGERLHYRHWFNERTQRRLFYASFEVQRRLGLTRAVPGDIQVMIGSQWWCLRRQTIERVLDFCRQRPDVVGFFRTTWIPDETFFQTLVPHIVPREEIRRKSLTFKMFTDYGMPVTLHDDHHDMLLGQDFLFARKISPQAQVLRRRLGDLWRQTGRDFAITGEGPALFAFTVGRGREGRRFGRRFWEDAPGMRRSHHLRLIVCRKWHVAKRLTQVLRAKTGIAAHDYVFNELEAALPDLGGIESSVAKRERHRRAFVRLLFALSGRDTVALCLDPGALGIIEDLASDRMETRILVVEAELDDAFVRGHVRNTGLAPEGATPEAVDRLVPVVRAAMIADAERVMEIEGVGISVLGPERGRAANAAQLASFLDLSIAEAGALLDAVPDLFTD